MTSNDMELVRAYARRNSEDAFVELVARHIHLVHSVALRQVRDPHLAEEVTQAVFVILARKAGSLHPKTILPGWLCRTARFVSANALTIQRRRERREQEAYMQSLVHENEAETWRQIAPLLDAALAGLGEKDHNALVLRFFENQSLKEVGAALGANEDAARKRVNRALEKLRNFFMKRGVVLSVGGLSAAIAANSVQAAPAPLLKSVTAIAITKGAAGSISTLTLIKGALKIMAWSKAKTTVVVGVIAILTVGTTTLAVKTAARHRMAGTGSAQTFKKETLVRMNQAKMWSLAFLMYANDNKDNYPTKFDQVRRYDKDGSFPDWEIVSGGNQARIKQPATTILLREKEARRTADGAYFRIYAFVDGHVEAMRSEDGDFAALEKDHGWLVVPAKN